MLHSEYESDMWLGEGGEQIILWSHGFQKGLFLNSLERNLSVVRSIVSSIFDQWFVSKELVSYQSVFMCQSSLKVFTEAVLLSWR